jgi:hypothetical protein
LQPTGPFGFTYTSGLFPTFGVPCANAPVENISAAIMRNDLMVAPLIKGRTIVFLSENPSYKAARVGCLATVERFAP